MKFRKPLKITGRASSITNAFVQAIIPRIEPSEEDTILALKHLGMTPDAMSCVYCGTEAMKAAQLHADHLRDEIRNALVSKAPDAD